MRETGLGGITRNTRSDTTRNTSTNIVTGSIVVASAATARIGRGLPAALNMVRFHHLEAEAGMWITAGRQERGVQVGAGAIVSAKAVGGGGGPGMYGGTEVVIDMEGTLNSINDMIYAVLNCVALPAVVITRSSSCVEATRWRCCEESLLESIG